MRNIRSRRISLYFGETPVGFQKREQSRSANGIEAPQTNGGADATITDSVDVNVTNETLDVEVKTDPVPVQIER